jgi:ethanolamine utilization protein EutN
MRIAKIRGTVTLNRAHPAMRGASYRLAVPMSLEDLRRGEDSEAEWLVVYDELGAGLGSLIMVSEGAEAAQPFYPEDKPIDAYNAGIIDRLDVGAAS